MQIIENDRLDYDSMVPISKILYCSVFNLTSVKSLQPTRTNENIMTSSFIRNKGDWA